MAYDLECSKLGIGIFAAGKRQATILPSRQAPLCFLRSWRTAQSRPEERLDTLSRFSCAAAANTSSESLGLRPDKCIVEHCQGLINDRRTFTNAAVGGNHRLIENGQQRMVVVASRQYI